LPWIQSTVGLTQALGLQQEQRSLLNHPRLQVEQQLRLRQQSDFNPNMANQFQQPHSSVNSRLSQQSKIHEPCFMCKKFIKKIFISGC
jgi:hypothetical protein